MRRLAIACLICVMSNVLASSSVAAPGPKVRTAAEEYVGGLAALVGYEATPNAYVGACDPNTDEGCVRFPLKRNDRFFTLRIEDKTGLPVSASVFGPDGGEIAQVCGETKQPIVSPGSYVDVWLSYGSCYESPQPSAPTSGVVEASFARSPHLLRD